MTFDKYSGGFAKPEPLALNHAPWWPGRPAEYVGGLVNRLNKVIGRIAEKALWLDLRCLEAEDEETFAAQWRVVPRPPVPAR